MTTVPQDASLNTATSRTYRAPAEASAPRLSGVRGVTEVLTEPAVVLETERYDTADLRLAAAGIRLELAREPGAAQWRLRLPDGADEHAELLRVPAPVSDVEGVDPPGPPAELDALVRGVRRDLPLRPVGRARTVRTRTRIAGPGDAQAELLRDEVTVATLGTATTVESWTEFELRRAGRRALLDELERRLCDVGAVAAEPATQAVLDRLLAPRPLRRAGGGKKGSAGAVLLRYLGAQVDRIAAEDVRVRREEPDSVHAMRVAARRARSALQVYRPLLDADRARALAGELRELGRALAPARDTEVQRERLASSLAALDPALVLGPVQAQVTRHFAREEAEARAALLSELDGERYATLRSALDELLADPPLTRRAARPASKELPRIAARRAARRLQRAVEELERHPSDEAVHRVRKDAKRMRYAAEVARPAVSGRQAKRFESGLKGLHQALGEHQDAVVSRSLLRELGGQAHQAGENGFTFGVLHGQDGAAAERARRDLPELWQRAWRPKARRWLR